jgi:hypothetical protein
MNVSLYNLKAIVPSDIASAMSAVEIGLRLVTRIYASTWSLQATHRACAQIPMIKPAYHLSPK